MTSEFHQRFSADSATRLATHFGNDTAAGYISLVEGEPEVPLLFAQIGDERKQRDRDPDFDGIALKLLCDVAIFTDPNHERYSGVSDPKQSAVVRVTRQGISKEFTIDSVLKSSRDRVELKLSRYSVVSIVSREMAGE